MNSSISRRLIFWLAVPLMLLALCGGLIHYFNSVAPGVISSDRRLKGAANALMMHLGVENQRFTLDANPNANPPLPPPDTIDYAVRDTQGRLLLGDAQLPAVAINDSNSDVFAMAEINQQSVRTLTTRFNSRGGAVLITVADARRANEPAVRYSFMSTLLWDFVQLDITLVLVWVGIRLGLRPITRLRDEIAARSVQDLRPIDEASVPREIAPVAVTLNRLFQMLRTSVQSQQQFIANTAHQLRTPLTGMQAQIDLLLVDPAAGPIRGRLQILQEGVRQLAHASNQLLTLARADPALNIAAKAQSVQLHTLVTDVVGRHIDRALQKDIDLGVDARSTTIAADPSLIDDLASNLIDNALKYTPSGGTVTVSTGEQEGRPFLSVEDTGPGIPEAERRLVRQRFYRLPNSSGHGSGLGLAIVDEIAKLYEAVMTITAGVNGLGTRVTVQFQPSTAK
ncbi:MAG TPA: sensor histidine kinase [Steroidobacteraceae bacterium]